MSTALYWNNPAKLQAVDNQGNTAPLGPIYNGGYGAKRFYQTRINGVLWSFTVTGAPRYAHCPWHIIKSTVKPAATLADNPLAKQPSAVLQLAAEHEVEALRAELATARQTLAFFARVIKSGEPWTACCQQQYQAAMGKVPD